MVSPIKLQVPYRPHVLPEEQHAAVEIDGNRVLIRGRRFHTTVSETAAARIASALMTLEAYCLLDRVTMPEDVVRSMLRAAVDEINPTDGAS